MAIGLIIMATACAPPEGDEINIFTNQDKQEESPTITLKLADDSPEGIIHPGGDRAIFIIEANCHQAESCTIYEMDIIIEGNAWYLAQYWLEDADGNSLTKKNTFSNGAPWNNVVFNEDITFTGTIKLSLMSEVYWGDRPNTEYPNEGFMPVIMGIKASEPVNNLPIKGKVLRSEFAQRKYYYTFLATNSPEGIATPGDNIELLRFNMTTSQGEMNLSSFYFNYNDFDGYIDNCQLYQDGTQLELEMSIYWNDWENYWAINFNPANGDYPVTTTIDNSTSTFNLNCDIETYSPEDQPVQTNLGAISWSVSDAGIFFESDQEPYNLILGNMLVF
jgi:hypothetical protein